MKKNVITYFLQSAAKPQPFELGPGFTLMECHQANPEFMQFLFKAVGQHWNWYSRLEWDYQTWLNYLSQDKVRNWVLYQKGSPVGYFELVQHNDNSVEIMFFGLLAQYYGKGLGSLLLNCAIEQAWKMEPQRVWLHTCSEDHPNALANYRARGFELFDTQEEQEDVPEIYDQKKLTSEFIYSTIKHFK